MINKHLLQRKWDPYTRYMSVEDSMAIAEEFDTAARKITEEDKS
jgi:hypothetical protein